MNKLQHLQYLNLRRPSRYADNITAIQAKPSLDLNFARNKSLMDNVTGNNLITFTRASSGTFVDSNGVLRSAVTNLLLRSEEFGTWWTPLRASVSSNTTTAPNGAATADTLIEDTTASNSHLLYSGGPQSAGTYTVSIYAKAAGRSVFQISQESGGNSLFTLTGNGTALALGANTVSINSVGNGWYRCASTYVASGAHFIYITLNNGTSTIYTGDGTSGIYLWGAQLEQSATVGEYIPTTSTINSAPRFAHNPTTGESLGLLVEEQRTNLLLRSEEVDNASWVKTISTVTANATTAPNGTLTADSLIEDITLNQHYATQTLTIPANTIHTATLYVKANTRSSVRFGFLNNALSSGAFAHFNVSTGVISAQTTAGTASNVSFSIEAAASGWYRCRTTCTVDSLSILGVVFIGLVDGTNNATYTGDGTSGIYIWGAQLEAGAFPTSYIPTTTASVTRSADIASITGANFSSWYNQAEGTVFAEYRLPAAGIGIATIDDGTANNIIPIFTGSAVLQAASANAIVAGANSGRIDSGGSFVANSLTRAAYAIKVADRALSANGASATTSATPSAMPVVTQLQIQGITTFAALKGGTIKRLTYFPTRLSNTVLQRITQ